MHAAELEGKVAEYDGYTAESRAGELLLGVGIPTELHNGPMSEVAPGWKLRVLLMPGLFANPDILLLDEPTNNLDINTIRWLEDVLNNRDCTMVIISHDRHFLNQVCTHMADLDYGTIRSTRATTTTTWKPRPWRASASRRPTPAPRTRSRSCRPSCAASRPTSPRPSRPPAA
jgi:ATPase subunit of ABC transporter with duplicated ATPase domains